MHDHQINGHVPHPNMPTCEIKQVIKMEMKGVGSHGNSIAVGNRKNTWKAATMAEKGEYSPLRLRDGSLRSCCGFDPNHMDRMGMRQICSVSIKLHSTPLLRNVFSAFSIWQLCGGSTMFGRTHAHFPNFFR